MKTIVALLFFALSFSITAQEKKIKLSELPADATEFIKANFKKSKVKTVVKDTDVKSKTVSYEVTFEDNTELEFKDTGSWKEVDGKGKVIPMGFIPKPFWDYIKQNYPSEEITHIDKEEQEIEVKLTNGVGLFFDYSGKLTRTEK